MMQLEMGNVLPLLSGPLTDVPVPSSLQSVWWVLVHADTMHANNLSSGEHVMVGLCSGPSAAASPVRSNTSFAPVGSSMPTGQVLTWGTLAENMYGPIVPTGSLPPWSATAAGSKVVLTRVWGEHKTLQRGQVALSSLHTQHCRGRPGEVLYVHLWRISQGPTPMKPPTVSDQGDPAGSVRLSLVWNPQTQLPVTVPTRVQSTATQSPPSPYQITPPSGKKGGRLSVPDSPAAKSSTSSAQQLASLRFLGSSILSEQAGLTKQLLLRHLQGRCLLPGNLVFVPILGHTLMFHVDAVNGTSDVPPTPCCCTPATDITFSLPSDKPDANETLTNFGVSESDAFEQLVRKAREAAAAAVQGSGQEAAEQAAEAALRAGEQGSGLDFSKLGGVEQYVKTLKELVSVPLKLPHFFQQYSIRPPRGVLLYGPPGSGKTLLARAAAADAQATFFVVNGPDIISSFYGESEAGLQGIFAAAQALGPSVIFIDEIDAVAPARQGGGSGGGLAAAGSASDGAARVVTVLLTLMDGMAGGSGNQVMVLAATNRQNTLDSALRRPGRFERELEIGVPTPEAREGILTARLRNVQHSLHPEEVTSLAARAHGFVGADLAALVDEAAMRALRRSISSIESGVKTEAVDRPEITVEDFRSAEVRIRPSAMREVAVEVPRVRWEDVGGLHGIKQHLMEMLIWPQHHSDALARLGAKTPQGILLYGPPGCSKTLLARAVACEAKLNFISIKGGELYSKFVGESEKAVARLFAKARAAAPCVVFFDEIDGLVGVRDETSAGVSSQVLAQLLMELDGLQARTGLVVLAATNRPDCVDPALLRPGRFDRLLFVPPPDCTAREEIFQVHLRKTPLGSDVSLSHLAQQTEGYTGADISAVCRQAAIAALEEDICAEVVQQRHFASSLLRVRPSVQASSSVLQTCQRFGARAGP